MSMGGILIDQEKQTYKEKYMADLADDEAILVRIATATEHQGKGAAKAIIQKCLEFARTKGVKCVQLSQTNKQLAAYALYKKFGFKTVKKYMLISFINFYLRQMNLEFLGFFFKLAQKMDQKIRVERIYFESDQLIESVHRCFVAAHKNVFHSAFLGSLVYLAKQTIYQLILLLITRFFATTLVTLFVIMTIVSVYQYFNHRKAWLDYVNLVLESSEISYERANVTFCKEKNAFFAAFNEKNEIVSIGGLLAEDEKYTSLKSWAPKLKEHDGLLVRVSTLPNYHCNGFGKEIVRNCVDFGKSLDLKCIKLCVTNKQKSAFRMYKSLGFKSNFLQKLKKSRKVNVNGSTVHMDIADDRFNDSSTRSRPNKSSCSNNSSSNSSNANNLRHRRPARLIS
ncbi:N-acetyltransferase 8 [Brachionus plicatilis]|uniref:N-acetyltransferase 8 n=1 Tax=Brachionus plicatilis TaxID=10195 RepID=A0A3M7RC46_BRAPC|nr:N-acetyltransferase 8 [Brachionus plicatilis]